LQLHRVAVSVGKGMYDVGKHCTTHDIVVLGQGELCPIGKIELATEKALARITTAAAGSKNLKIA
jgi:hypothetical protein